MCSLYNKYKCPYDALEMENGIDVVDYNYCTLCGLCVKSCEYKALELGEESSQSKKDITDYRGVGGIVE
ncbi:MAG: 4Fe-4S binding protein [Halanaerobiales bacterium]